MSLLKGGMTVLLLAVPFAAYAVLQLQGATRSDLFAEPPPDEKGLPTKEQLVATRVRSEQWAAELQEAATAVWQFRPTIPETVIAPTAAPTADKEVLALVRLAAARSANLTDLEKFLSGVERPVYLGALKERYVEWQASRAELVRSEEAIDAWLRSPLPGPVDGLAAATQALKGFADLIAEYKRGSKFADARKADAWQVEARVKVMRELAEAAQKPYAAVLELPLPLPDPASDKLVERAVGVPAALRDQARALRDDLARAEERRALTPRLDKLAQEVLAVADEWAARDELLKLLADRDLFTDPNKAAEWVPRVQAQLNKTPTDAGRAVIRRKVQQFCDAYIPKAVLLDEAVLIQGKPEPRAGVIIEYDSDAKAQPLTDRLDKLNEFNFLTAYKNFDRIVWANGSKYTGNRSALQPTPRSLVARDYTLARATVTTWSAATVNRLKIQCEGPGDAVQQQERRSHLDELVGAAPGQTGGSPWTKQNTKIWTRLSALSAATAKHPALFENEP